MTHDGISRADSIAQDHFLFEPLEDIKAVGSIFPPNTYKEQYTMRIPESSRLLCDGHLSQLSKMSGNDLNNNRFSNIYN